jgi:hypothetical protein
VFHLDFVLFGYDKQPLLELLRQKQEELQNKTVILKKDSHLPAEPAAGA